MLSLDFVARESKCSYLLHILGDSRKMNLEFLLKSSDPSAQVLSSEEPNLHKMTQLHVRFVVMYQLLNEPISW